MRQVIFIHSAGPQGEGEGSIRFLAALRSELGPHFDLTAPVMPDPEAPDAGPWEAATGDLLAAARAPFALVGHSFGGSTILNHLAKNGVPSGLAGVVTIAAPFWGNGGWDVPDFALPADAGETLAAVPQIVIFRGRDDADVTPARSLPAGDPLGGNPRGGGRPRVRKWRHRGGGGHYPWPAGLPDRIAESRFAVRTSP